VTVGEALQLLELLAKVGTVYVERQRGRSITTLTPAEVRLAAHELLAGITPWDDPVDEPIGEDADD
jgi:hypothetical protein